MWFLNGDPKLSEVAKKSIEDPANQSFVSIASIWEMAVKVKIGKLTFTEPFDEVVSRIPRRGFSFAGLEVVHALFVSELELHHRDPFDRMLIAQTKIGDMAIVSNEAVFDKYGVKRIW